MLKKQDCTLLLFLMTNNRMNLCEKVLGFAYKDFLPWNCHI
ncbi:hypothetical protein X559_0735 [Paenilisteria newyorkensis]|nr:hypothetical protein X559_0735 [Listeria newyorkensis]